MIRRVGWLVIAVVVLYFVAGAGYRWLQYYRYQGQWVTFDSQDYYQTNTFPDGVRFEYPANWRLLTYKEGGTLNQGTALRIRLIKPNFIFSAGTWFTIWWQRVDETWSSTQILKWYIEDVERVVDREELIQKLDSFEPIAVGAAEYPALLQSFESFNLGPFASSDDPLRKVVLLQVEDEVFAITFSTSDSTDGSLETFERILGTLEIYK